MFTNVGCTKVAEEAGQALGLVLLADHPQHRAAASAARTRWAIAATPNPEGPSYALPLPRWHIELVRAKGAAPGAWTTIWHGLAEGLTNVATTANPAPELHVGDVVSR